MRVGQGEEVDSATDREIDALREGFDEVCREVNPDVGILMSHCLLLAAEIAVDFGNEVEAFACLADWIQYLRKTAEIDAAGGVQ